MPATSRLVLIAACGGNVQIYDFADCGVCIAVRYIYDEGNLQRDATPVQRGERLMKIVNTTYSTAFCRFRRVIYYNVRTRAYYRTALRQGNRLASAKFT